MYTLIIVDDEYDIRKAIINTINWAELGFEIVGEAENGRDAIELIGLKNPDVVITDIKMPFVDGIALTEAIRETNPTVKVVFLTGFDDFEYAVSAVKLSVFEYLLKPISAKNLTATMSNIKKRLDDEIKQIQDIELLKETYNENIPVMRFGLLMSLINNSREIKNLERKMERYGIGLKGDTHMVFTVKPDRKSIAKSALKTDDPELILLSIRNMAKIIIEKYVSFETFIYNENVVAVISDTKENISLYSHILINELQQTAQKYYNISTVIGVSNAFDDLRNTREAYQSSIAALHYAFVPDGGKIINIGDFEPKNAVTFLYDESREQRLQSMVKMCDTAAIEALTDEIFEDMLNKKAALADCQLCMLGMFSTLLKVSKAVMPEFETDILNSLNFISELYKKDSLDEIKRWFLDICKNTCGYIGLKRQNSSAVLADKGYDYLKGNFNDPSVSLKSVSEHLFISPGYLSSVFKKELGETFSDCLTRIRMEKAKELLYTTGLKIFEIGAQIGYTDQHYFSYCYKKYYGLSPNESRSSKR